MSENAPYARKSDSAALRRPLIQVVSHLYVIWVTDGCET